MNETINLHLPQWEETDRILRTDFNGAMEAIDTGVKAVNDAVTTLGTTKATAASVTALAGRVSAVESGKADAATVSALQTTVSGKADSASVTAALAQKADSSTVSALQSAVNACGNCHIAMGSYVGTGECGADHPNTLTFDFRPLVLWVNTTEKYNSAAHVVFTNPGTLFGFPNANSASFRVAWSDRGVSWYAGGMNTYLSANYQYNESGRTVNDK